MVYERLLLCPIIYSGKMNVGKTKKNALILVNSADVENQRFGND